MKQLFIKRDRNALGAALLTLVRQTHLRAASQTTKPPAPTLPTAPVSTRRPDRFAPDLERAHEGIMPRVPRFAPAIEDRLGTLKRKVTRAARNHSLTELRDLTFPTSSGSRKKLDRYRRLAIIATEARIAALAERRMASKG